ncbi:amino acid ABC transporter permease [uncultured Succiniclasticum sp.]|jgi:L-cystine transport system permease protein|uniref:amino acid ABC transporter permease n=1 Tax=uncultured Succiniclasticum sp. TaxID=1500547 RepID=UPI0025CC2091|nr:amino acid ABC transporter permease [uncultured Succiniclasticum sp.]
MRPFEPQLIPQYLVEVFPYLSVTLGVTVSVIIFGSLLGGVIAWGKISGGRVVRSLATGYTYILRCTPSIILLFLIFYGLPKFVLEAFGYDINGLSRAVFVIISFTLLYAASSSEVMRAAYLSVDHGQYEAAVSIGLSSFTALRRIVLPQAAVVALPNFGNSVLNLMKEGSLAYTIGLIDLLGEGNLIISRQYGGSALEVYTAVGLIYLGLAFLITRSTMLLEQKLLPQKTRPERIQK